MQNLTNEIESVRRALLLQQNGLQQWSEAKTEDRNWTVDPDLMLKGIREDFERLKEQHDRLTNRLRHSRGASD